MADVRCPMCGKANPAELDECQYCQARLRPIWDTAPSGAPSDDYEDQTTDLPDWLKTLRAPEEGSHEQPAPGPEEQTPLSDWLGSLRQQPPESTGAPEGEIADEAAEKSKESSSDWLQSILSEDELAEDAGFARQMNEAFQQDDASWLSRIGSTPIEEERPVQPSDEPLDWLTELEQAAPDISPAGGQDWYASPAEEPTGEEALPSWLQQAASSIQETAEPAELSEADWMKLAPAESAAEQPAGDEDVNWLTGGEEELPEWLFGQPAAGETAESPAESAAETQAVSQPEFVEPGEAETTWEELQAPAAQPAEEVQPAEVFDEELPGWLFSDEEAPDLLATGEETPDWLKPPLETQEAELAAMAAAEEPLPAELFDLEQPGELEQEFEAEGLETPAEEIPPWLVGAGAVAVGLGLEQSAEQPAEDLGWLNELESVYGTLSPNAPEETKAGEGEIEGLEMEPGTALPAWLSKTSEEEAGVLDEGVEAEAELKPAEMPSWLQAMRPVGVTAAAASLLGESEPSQVEGAGPLAGLRGALPAEPDVSQVQKPPVYSVKLQVTDAQQLQSELLRGLIDSEGQPQALPGRPAIGSQRVIRLFIAVLLIFPLIFVLLTGVPQLSLPALTSQVDATARLIDSLQPGAAVLLAVDYQPGFSGEMDAITSPVLQQLFARGAHVAAVSTISTGPVQAEHLLAQVRGAGGAPLQGVASFTNLGYIPGGATGLLAFAQSPRTTLPTDLRGAQVWDTPALQSVDTLGEFALVIVATENPDVARYWIEQVQPGLGPTPLVMVLSAQAEPLVWPYYQASPSQVQGLIGGLAGGVAYLSRGAQTGTATGFWSPYGVGALIAVMLMVLVGLVNLVSAQVERRKAKAGGKKSP